MLYLNNHFHGLVNISRKTCSRIWTKIRVIFNAIVLGEGFCRMQYRVSIFSKTKLKSIVGKLLSAISFELKVSIVDMLPNCLLQFSFESKLFWCYNARTTDTQWRHKSKKSEKLGRCGRQNMLRPYLKIWEWEWIFGHAVKAISSLGIRSLWSRI